MSHECNFLFEFLPCVLLILCFCINDIFDARGHDLPARTLAKQLRFNHQVFSCCISYKQGRNQDFFGGKHNSPNALVWDMINTLFVTTEAVEPTFVAFL